MGLVTPDTGINEGMEEGESFSLGVAWDSKDYFRVVVNVLPENWGHDGNLNFCIQKFYGELCAVLVINVLKRWDAIIISVLGALLLVVAL